MVKSISVIVPMPPDLTKPTNENILKKWKGNGIEIIVVKGKNPSKQRNEGAKAAKGEILYFLDEDSIPEEKNLDIIQKEFETGTDIMGGPSIMPDQGPVLEEVYYHLLSCKFIVGKLAGRYEQYGVKRPSDEGELILCNLAIRKEIFLSLGGFLEDLYPNEENEFLSRAKKSGKNIIYDPAFVVKKAMNIKIPDFIKLIFKYGRGRGMQTRLSPRTGNLLKSLSFLFLPTMIISLFISPLDYIAGIYFLYNILFSMLLSNWSAFTFFHYFLLVPVIHSTYGIGVFAGLILKKRSLQNKDFEIIQL